MTVDGITVVVGRAMKFKTDADGDRVANLRSATVWGGLARPSARWSGDRSASR
jgi:hypothetical protein